jgi:5,10-methylenetetrahydromethanopterin reductase
LEDVVRRLKDAYDYYRHLEAEAPYGDLVPDELVDQFAIAGNPDECRLRVREIAASGIDQLAVVPFCPFGQDRATMFSDFMALARA